MKKKITQKTMIAMLCLASSFASAQNVATFESLTVPSIGYFNGSANPGNVTSYTDGNCQFYTGYAGGSFPYWESGMAYTNVVDTTDGTYTNLYGCAAGKGFAGSDNYISAQQYSGIKLINGDNHVNGFYVTNSFYSFSSIKFGDGFDTPFGGTSGALPDYFKLLVRGYLNGVLKPDSVEFYLADFRFTNNTQDYIIKNWSYVDCSGLLSVDSLSFEMKSSRNNQFGITTPLFFNIDNISTGQLVIDNVNELLNTEICLYPNPATNYLHVNSKNNAAKNIKIIDVNGKIVLNKTMHENIETIDISPLAKGIYFAKISDEKSNVLKKFIIE